MSSTPSEETSPNSGPAVDPPSKIYRGGCHCGKFEFECRHSVLEDGAEVTSCNCSLCIQRGYLLMYIFDPKNFKFIKGSENELTHYQFNKKVIAHMFCPVCGSAIIAKGDASMGNAMVVNARTLSDIDVDALKVKMINGRAA